MAELRDALHATVRGIVGNETDVEPPETDPFEEYHHQKTYALDVKITPANDLTLVVSKFDFGYEVRGEHHRRVLNALLGTGIGAKRSYGFGCLQTREAGYRMGGREQEAVA
jgi:CRISPR-associated endoribonuclease Cas6